MATAQGAYDLSCDSVVAMEGAYNPSCDGIVAGQAGAYNPPCCVIVVATAAGLEPSLPLFLPPVSPVGGLSPSIALVFVSAVGTKLANASGEKVHLFGLLPPLPGLGVGERPRSLVCA